MSRFTHTSMRALILGMLLVLAGPVLAQQNYPNKPIRIITPFAAGGSSSIVARIFGMKLTESWGQQVLIDNRPGGNTIIGTEALVRSAPDGYTVLVAMSSHLINPLLVSNLPYDSNKDFAPVATIGATEYMLALHPSVPAGSLREFIAYAKSKPGELNYSTSGSGGTGHLAGELFAIMAGVKITHIPYKGGAPSVTDLVGGQVQLSFVSPANVMAHLKSGRLKGIAISGKKRTPALPQMPTFSEAGLPDFEARNWFGVFAPAGTSKEIIDKLSTEFARLQGLADVQEKLGAQGVDPYISSPDQFAAMMSAESARYAKVIKAANIKADK